MRMYDIIAKKRAGAELTDAEIRFFVEGYVAGNIPNYQMAALLMAICWQGMNDHETACLTMEMANSGDLIDLSPIPGIKVDKHSTGGVGDKTTLVVAPLVAALGVPVAKMSGRGLGHTGGTVDKLESIPGYQTELSIERFFEVVNSVGASVVGQTGNLAPADKKFYALRDVTATVESVPLIASSVMSKKIAAGADRILLEVTCGNGAFMRTPEEAIELSKVMVAIGEEVGRTTVALITDMNTPLGTHIGNSLEVIEVCNVLQGRGPKDTTEVCVELAANMAYLADRGSLGTCRRMVREQIENGKGFEKFCEMVTAQGGDASYLRDTSKFPQAKAKRHVYAPVGGRVYSMDTLLIGIASVSLGAGRATMEDTIDMAAGIVLERKTGDRVEKGEILATIYAQDESRLDGAERAIRDSYEIRDAMPEPIPHFYARISKDGVEHLDR